MKLLDRSHGLFFVYVGSSRVHPDMPLGSSEGCYQSAVAAAEPDGLSAVVGATTGLLGGLVAATDRGCRLVAVDSPSMTDPFAGPTALTFEGCCRPAVAVAGSSVMTVVPRAMPCQSEAVVGVVVHSGVCNDDCPLLGVPELVRELHGHT